MVKEFKGTFGDFLVMKRKEQGLTIKEVAQKLKISPTYYGFFEADQRKAPEREVQDQIANILEMTEEERLLLYDLAGQTRGIIAADLPEYINSNPYVRVALRQARDSKAGEDEWLRFIAQLKSRKAGGK